MTFSFFVIEYRRYAKVMSKPSRGKTRSEKGTVQALRSEVCKPLISAAREDRDGSSRYRASKMSPLWG